MPFGLNLGETLEDIQGKPNQSQGGSPDTLEEQDFTSTFGSNLQAGEWVDAAVYTVEAQTQYNVGYGKADRPETMGRWYATFTDGAGNAVTGQCRILTRDANDENVDEEIAGVSTSRLDSDPNDFRKQKGTPEVLDTPKVGEDSKIILQFKLKSGSAGTSIDFGASDFMLDMTRY